LPSEAKLKDIQMYLEKLLSRNYALILWSSGVVIVQKRATWSSCCRDYRHLFLPLRNVAASRWERWSLILFFFWDYWLRKEM
jgi:hypothetical protein